jgi:hypothetical protein
MSGFSVTKQFIVFNLYDLMVKYWVLTFIKKATTTVNNALTAVVAKSIAKKKNTELIP